MKRISILPYEPHQAIPVAELLSGSRRAWRKRFPLLPPGLDEARAAGRIIDLAGPGWLAFGEGGRLAGFLFPERRHDETWGDSVVAEAEAWTLAEDGGEEALPLLYGAAFEAIGKGLATHTVYCPAGDESALQAWFSLGFGKEQAYGLASLNELRAEPPLDTGLELRRAKPGDEDILAELSPLIALCQAAPPTWAGSPPSYLADLREGFGKLPADESAIVLLAFRGSKAVGYQAWFPKEGRSEDELSKEAVELAVGASLPEERGRGVGLALTARGIEEAKQAGYSTVYTDWRTANPLSSSFWPARGFKPYLYRLARRLDPKAI